MKHEILKQVSKDFEKSNQIQKDVVTFLGLHGFAETARHSASVAVEAKRLALRFGEDQEAAATAAWLHDVSAIFPNEKRIVIAKGLDIIPLPEEETFPLIIHQRISKVMAEEIFGVTDNVILNAIGCHTTLKKDATRLDKILFVGDKIKWDQGGEPPYLEQILQSSEVSLDAAVLSYLEFMWNKKDKLVVVHPWLKEAYEQLSHKKWDRD